MDYLIGKLPHQTEVQIRIRIKPDSNTHTMIGTSLLFTIGRQSVIMTKLMSSANVFRRVLVPKHNILNI